MYNVPENTGDPKTQKRAAGPPPTFLVSACLIGLRTRYDGGAKPCARCVDMLAGRAFVPFCPEQLGGLPTPRPAADLKGGDGFDVLAGRARVIRKDGADVTGRFIAGARQVLDLAGRYRVAAVLLKSRSPSCGVAPAGVTAALLRRHGYRLIEF